MLQFMPALNARGIDVEEAPLLDDIYVTGLYAGRLPLARVGRSYLRRLQRLLSARAFDAIWVEKEIFPWLPAIMDLALIPKKKALIVDYDDAVFHSYDMHQSHWVRAMLGNKIDTIMRRADIVVVGNAYLAQRAQAAGCRYVEQIPTVVDLNRYSPRNMGNQAECVVIGWIGSPATAGYLQAVAPVLTQLNQVRAIRCVAIGARPDQVLGTPFEAVEWTEDSEAAQLRQLDIGIMPLPDAAWEQGKCGYKLIQYMACGLPVVASPVGANRDVVRAGENGYLAADNEGWADALMKLIDDRMQRQRMGRTGRSLVEAVYCVQAQAPRLAELFERLANRGGS